ncbi:MAG: hypothetical protein WCG27_12565 [Pseudomonadota bacterium]
MPIKDLVLGIPQAPENIKKIATGLVYRDFITIGLLAKELDITNQTKIKTLYNLIPDNWIYIQERDVHIGRLQIFNNWSPYMVKELTNVWMGLEYFCNEGDHLWSMKDQDLINLGISELEKIAILNPNNVLDATVIRMPKAYPAYFGTYDQLNEIKDYLKSFKNLYLIGRNGMHRYNNQDHSVLSAMTAIDNIVSGRQDQENIWAINTEEDYHEENSQTKS